MTIITKIEKKLLIYCADKNIALPHTSLLLSYSGGIDSSVLADILIKLRKKHGFQLGFAHFNHHGNEISNNTEIFCSEYAHNNKVQLYKEKLNFRNNQNFESSARKQRYFKLNNLAKIFHYNFILTAHHKDDQIETIFMKKKDGSDWISKIGIREKMRNIRRPFLEVCKNEIKAYSKQKNIYWVEDPTNNDLKFRRNRIRHLDIPHALKTDKALNNKLLSESKNNIIRYISIIQTFNKIGIQFFKNCSRERIVIHTDSLINYTREEMKIFFYWCLELYMNIELKQQSSGLWFEFNKFLKKAKTGSLFIIDTLTFLKNRDELIVIRNYDELNSIESIRLKKSSKWHNGLFKSRNTLKTKISGNKNLLFIPEQLYEVGLYVRTWKHGDKIVSATSGNNVLISDIFVDNKLSKYDKLIQPILVDNFDTLLWVPSIMHGAINFTDNSKFKRIIEWIKV